jgi:WD40 repeat protein
VIATKSGGTEVWDVSSWKVQQQVAASSPVYFLAISPDNHLLAGATDYDTEIWNLPTQKRAAVLHAPFDCYCLNALAFSPDGTMLASADGDTAISQLATWRCPRCGANMCIGPNLTAQQLAFRCKLPDTS